MAAGPRSDARRLARAAWLVVLAFSFAALAHWRAGRAPRFAARSPWLHVTVTPIPGLAVAARIAVVAPGATSIVACYGAEAGLVERAARIAVPPNGRVSTALLGLNPGATSHVEVIARYPDGQVRSSGDLTVQTPPMDPIVPTHLPISVDEETNGPVLLSMNGGEGVGGIAVIVGRKGRVLWYRRCGGGAFAFELLPNKRLILHQSDAQWFEELELDGTVVRTWNDTRSLTGADGHDFRLLPSGNALLWGAESHFVDSRPHLAGGDEHSLRWDDVVSEVSPAGAIVWRWSSYGNFSEEEITDDVSEPFDPHDYEVVHTNSIDPLLDGSMLLSLRNLSTVAKIDRAGHVVWRLGGKRSDFRFENDPLNGFSRQHDARLIGPGRILLFDNGNLHTPPESRAAEYRLDEAGKVATLVWEHRRKTPLFSRISGSVQRLPDGHTLIAWGPRGVVSEVDARSRTIWELTTPHFGVYRARAVESLYAP